MSDGNSQMEETGRCILHGRLQNIAAYSLFDEVLQVATVRLKLTQWLTGIGDYRNVEKPVHLRFKSKKA